MHAEVFSAQDVFTGDPPPLSGYGRRLLAEGDSWFTLGTLNPAKGTNLLLEMEVGQSTAIVSAAYPGDTLQHMVEGFNDPHFDRLLRVEPFARWWEAILVSAGGNDLIDAAQLRPLRADGSPAALDERLLLTPAEAEAVHPGQAGAGRFVSEPGWLRLAGYLRANFEILVRRRDEGVNRGQPIILHTYAVPVVHPAGTLGAREGWLYPALRAYGIPEDQRQGVAEELFERLRQLLLSLDAGSGHAGALPAVRVFDSARLVALEPASPTAEGESGDWINEIHPNRRGYIKLGRALGAFVDAVLQS